METDTICFPAPLNTCFPLFYGGSTSIAVAEDETVLLLKQNAEPGCYLCVLDAIPGEDWD
jgi:hypothetical protein